MRGRALRVDASALSRLCALSAANGLRHGENCGRTGARSFSYQAKQVKQARVITDHHDCGVPLHASAGERGRSSAAHQKGCVGHDSLLPTEPFLVAPTRPVPPRVRGHAGDAGNSVAAESACPGPLICTDGEGAASTRCIRPCTSGQCWHMSHGSPGPRKPAPGPRQRPTQPCTVRPERPRRAARGLECRLGGARGRRGGGL